jgi:large subunit ribosomal protein L28
MARRCELTGKGVLVGHRVSHANNKTKHRFKPNVAISRLMSDTLAKTVTLKISAHALRSIDHNGGLDNFILKQSDDVLSQRALRVKKDIAKAVAKKAA